MGTSPGAIACTSPSTSPRGWPSYLHDLPDGAVVHRNVKPTNVLLGDDLWAKLSNFGVCTMVRSEITHISTEVKGTCGYVDPEYFSAG
ncbi:hypothetical protein Taro_054811 [Colocasia esculenta]|uniref:Protein kinase domain-containing protein n=1 Tax=Colocasia esculenta TaxID=4460 RepID=A0A843XR44_COLES|nr:hypothetical protein [Colocasia esculenta]